MSDFIIGVLGGMGTYATIHLFEQYAEIFPAEKEWERPRIVIDNRCTMPSRVKAFLYNENVNELIEEMTDSMKHLIEIGCNRIILACNTSHLFLPQIYTSIPELESRVIHIIKNCVDEICVDKIESVLLLASEGTIDSKIYQNELEKRGIKCIAPKPEEYILLRKCIEAVKQNNYTNEVKKIFINLVERYDSCILGCTELPILYEKYCNEIQCENIYDPLRMGLIKLRKEFENE